MAHLKAECYQKHIIVLKFMFDPNEKALTGPH